MTEAENDPALIGIGLVLPGATRIVGLGGNETYRGVVETGGRPVNCYIKFLDVRLILRAAEIVSKALRDADDQQRFVAHVRRALADDIERGEPLRPVRLRESRARRIVAIPHR
jgi:hypothetical protein